MRNPITGLLKWFLILAISIALLALFIHVIMPLALLAVIIGGVYYLFKRNHLARERAKYTPEGRKKVN
ncbi:hypothetical protein [Companilactobacillus sp.]|uniref:hypothetical protein n=1 Tax=Companilactobacillus sp. TaxID=2767905 RepID=UPI0026285B6D|nr:hypothetical protein [Companilactobacillus sp.]